MGALTWVLLQFTIFGALSVTCDSFVSVEVWALTAFKEAIYEDPYLVLADWNGLDVTPCQWSGVTCSVAKDHVVKLNISGSSLKGFIAPELGLLNYLQELTLHGNHLIGIIPKEIGLLKNLTVLDLGANQLSGPIPHEIGNLSSIKKINLQSNGLTGMLPHELGDLKFLQELHLDRNKLQGTVPGAATPEFKPNMHGMYATNGNATGLCRLPQLKVADFSYNFFGGSIPKCLLHLPSASFQGNCLEGRGLKQRSDAQCGSSINAKSHSNSNASTKHKSSEDEAKHRRSRPTWLLALEIVTGTMVGILLITALITTYKRCNSKSSMIIPWKKSGSDKERLAVYIADSELLRDIQKFNRQDLEVACEDFSNIIGSSSDSMIYKGIMKGGSEIAVISFCIKEEQWTGYHELYFQREVADLARLNHENAAKLLGYCRETPPFTRMLVFEYACNGTLYEHLHSMFADGEGCQLSWTRRMKIIIGIARGLRYLHTELNPPFTISELNSSAVYLTEDFSPKLVDFESWKTIIARSEKNSSAIDSNGAICVLPRSIEARHLDIKGNVYAFGVLLLEIVSGRPPFSKDTGSLVDWAREYLEVPEVMPYIVEKQLKHFEYEDLKAVCEAASLCLNPDPVKRPLMHDLCTLLESRIDLSMSAELRSSSLAWAELALST
ncbi:probable LRR receptor-like serine/threonine-protein kinase At1g63430 isoform X1 [Chenopodium quinoa]|uniref:Protein kinase domain-containing protein n=1 Tax=Chenopodium quinoa TaxID=63459 RepID=A0A803LQM9_CHEQI|nr:probable LRR receptor-like serine/threonine-protein kinase At1g63430 isoform X1 [Chenopodium quinoa]